MDSTSPSTPPFHSSPQKFSQARRKAAEVTQSLVGVMSKGPRTIIGTVADTSFHLTQQYVTCTTQLGIVQVYGVPLGSVIPGMRVYCRQIGGMATNKSFVFDGFASSLASLGAHGSLIFNAISIPLNAGYATVADVSAQAGLTGPVGYYWHCFFYLPSVPLTTVTLFSMTLNPSVITFFTVQILPTCFLQVLDNTGHGYITNTPVSPHALHWLVIQPGNTDRELLIDGLANYTGITTTTDRPVFAGGTNTYTLWIGSNANASQLVPVGSWLSKFGYGVMTSGTLPTTVPAYDTDLVNANVGGTVTKVLYLFEDDPGSAEAQNSASGAGASTLAIAEPASIVQAGPY